MFDCSFILTCIYLIACNFIFVPYLIYCFIHDPLVLLTCIVHLYHLDSCICIYTLLILRFASLSLLLVFLLLCLLCFSWSFLLDFAFHNKLIKLSFAIINGWKRENLAVASFFPELSWWPDSWLVIQATLILKWILK